MTAARPQSQVPGTVKLQVTTAAPVTVPSLTVTAGGFGENSSSSFKIAAAAGEAPGPCFQSPAKRLKIPAPLQQCLALRTVTRWPGRAAGGRAFGVHVILAAAAAAPASSGPRAPASVSGRRLAGFQVGRACGGRPIRVRRLAGDLAPGRDLDLRRDLDAMKNL